MLYGCAEGGSSDEKALRALLTAHSAPTPLSPTELRASARWAAASAVLLLRERRDAFDALCDALREGRSVGECAYVVETLLGDRPADTAREDDDAELQPAAGR